MSESITKRLREVPAFHRIDLHGQLLEMKEHYAIVRRAEFYEIADAIDQQYAELRDACNRLIQTVRVAEDISECGLIDKRFENELRDMGFEV